MTGKIRIQTSEANAFGSHRAGDDLCANQRTKWREIGSTGDLDPILPVVEGLHDDVHVVELTRDGFQIVLGVAFLLIMPTQ